MNQLIFNLRNVFLIIVVVKYCFCKFIEGEIRTSDNWAFLTRFCFLSEQGTFEFYFEFRNDQGYPNLLLYYDAPDQWPAVYKTDKTCQEKESVLHINQNQIVNLTIPRNPLEDLAGCTLHIVDDNPHEGIHTTLKPTDKPEKAVTFTVNLGTRKPLTTPAPVRITTEATYDFTTNNNNNNDNNSTIYSTLDSVTENEYNSTDFSDIYDDQSLFGEDIYNNQSETNEKSREKRSVLHKIPDVLLKKGIVTCRNSRKFRSSRARWWFIAISNCNGNKGIQMKYQVLMTNGNPGDYWHEHFSADEFYVLPVLLAFGIAYGVLFFAIIICSVELKSRQLLHTTYKIFVLSVVFQLIGIALTTMAYLKYAVSGVLPYRTKVFGGWFMGASEMVFLLLLLLLAKGYTTTRGRLSLSTSIKLTIFMCLYAITFLTLFIYEAKVFDPGEVLYLYESPAGYGLITLRIIAWWIFIYSTIITLKHYPEKANFYYPFNICGTLWFIAGPAFILSANSYVDKWVRESVVCGVLLFITFAGHLMFLILTLPSMANKNFPYHIRTTQIGVMEVHGIAGAGTLDQFNHHVYQPSIPLEHTVIIPLHSQTEDIFTTNYKKTEEKELSDEEIFDEEHTKQNIDNVLKWSIVRRSITSGRFGNNSRMETENDELDDNSIINSPKRIFNSKKLPKTDPSLTEWTKDVPVELFTISKMVINKPNNDLSS